MKHIPQLSALCLMGLTALSSVAAPTATAPADTMTIQHYRILPAQRITAPIMSDTTDLYGVPYRVTQLLSSVPTLDMDARQLTDMSTGADGYYTLPSGGTMLSTLMVSLLTTQYEHVTAIVESPVPYALYLGTTKVGSRDTYVVEGTENYTLHVEPSAHRTLTLRLLDEGQSGDSLQHRVRVRLVPQAGARSSLVLRTDAREYMSMDFTLSGDAFSGVRMSPSGKYTIVYKRHYVSLESKSSAALYEGTRKRADLSGELAYVGWMPQSDRLYTTRQTDSGRQLIVYDPETLSPQVIGDNIPSGYFSVLPDEQHLLYSVAQEGPELTKHLDRVTGRGDHNLTNPGRDRYQLHLYSLATGLYTPLTFGHRSVALEAASPRTPEVILATNYDTTEVPFQAADYVAVNYATGAVDTLFVGATEIGSIYYTADPSQLLISGTPNAFDGIGRKLPESVDANTYDTQLYLYDRGTRRVRPLTRDFDPSVGYVRTAHSSMRALFSAEDRDYRHLFTLDLRSGQITKLSEQEDIVSSFGADSELRYYAFEGESANNSDRLYIGDTRRREATVVEDLAAHRLANIDLGTYEAWTYTMPDGSQVPGRYYLPPNFDPTKKYPLLVYYYGGTSPSSRNFDWYYSQPMYAGQGYVVLTLNPSGTTGWGQEYSARHVNAWGRRTADEIIAATKGFCAQHSYVDSSRVGCFGASYGGFMTQYLQTQTDIFAAAMSHAGISSITSYWGQGTWGIGYSTAASYKSYPWNNPQMYTEQSPLFNADKINTPLLLLHGTADVNVPYGESVQMYNALKILGKEVELVRVYDADHIVYDLHKRRAWMSVTMAWFQKWLKDDPTWWDDLFPSNKL